MLLHLQGLDEQHERLFANRLSHRTADGALLIAPKYVGPELADLRRRGFPVVVIEHRGGQPDVPSVSALHYEGARQATEYLLSLGHSRIATITGDLDEHSGQERLRGYRDALAAAGIWCRDDDIVTGDYTPASGSAAMRLLLSRPSPLTAVFAGNDLMALAALSVIKDAGLAVPQDVSIVGFDDIPIAAGATPPLTTVRQPIVEMGHLAATMLLNLIEGRPVAPEHVNLPTTLVVRSSCSRPPRRAHQARTITNVT
jgi:LacI family transcriptional regulator